MDVLFRDMHTAARPLRRRIYNYGGRHLLGWGGRAVEYGVGGSAALLAEHGPKSAWWGTRGVGWLAASAYNGVSGLAGGRLGQIPRPPMGYHWRHV